MERQTLKAIIGAYTGEIYIYELIKQQNEEHVVKAVFKDKPHEALVKCITTANEYLATAGSDDKVLIYDLNKDQLVHECHPHTGTVTAMQFTPELTHLITGGDDGVICATDLSSFMEVSRWENTHKGTKILDISIAPFGCVLLSLGDDGVVCTWDMGCGRVIYRTNLKAKSALGSTAKCIQWSLYSSYFSLRGPNMIEIRSIDSANVVRTFKSTSEYICMAWVSDGHAIAGKSDGKLEWLTVEPESKENSAKEQPAHDSRVKAVSYCDGKLVSVESAGCLKFWYIDYADRVLTELAHTNVPCRPISLGVTIATATTQYLVDPTQIQTLKRKHVQSETDVDVYLNVNTEENAETDAVGIEIEDDNKCGKLVKKSRCSCSDEDSPRENGQESDVDNDSTKESSDDSKEDHEEDSADADANSDKDSVETN